MTAVDQDQLAKFLDAMPLATTLGIVPVAASPDEVVATLDWAPERCTSGGVMHGGALMALADTVGAVCAFLNLPDGAGTSTISSTTTFLRGVREGTVTATARPIHAGRRVIAVETELTNGDRVVAKTSQTQAVLS